MSDYMGNGEYLWTDAKKGEVYKAASNAVKDIENRQGAMYRKFQKLAHMYDPRQSSQTGPTRRREAIPSFNVIATSVDSVHASLASQPVRSRIVTDGAEWSEQRRAKQLQKYADCLGKRLRVPTQAKRVVFASSLKGLGLAKVTGSRFGDITVEPTQPDNIFVDDDETDNCENSKLHHRYYVDANELEAEYPKQAKKIGQAKGAAFSVTRNWRKKRQPPNQVVVIESWSFPVGKQDEKGYKAGRHTVCIDGCDLLDEDYHKRHFPFALFRWTDGDGSSFFGTGGAERIALHQAKLAKIDYCTDRQIENNARPVTYTTIAALAAMQRTINPTGQYVATADGSIPKTVTPPAVSPQQLQYREQIKQEAYEEFGTSRMLVSGDIPVGIESGVGVREASKTSTGRFALQEQDFEQLNLDITWLILDVCKDLGKDAPYVHHTTFKGAKKTLNWGDVDMELVREQMSAASSISKTPAGKASLAGEMVQLGMISLEESRRLLENPDVSRSLSLYTAASESVERKIEEMLDGEILMPTPHDPLKMEVLKFTMAIQAAENDGAPEDAIERLRNYKVFASDMLDKQEARQAAAMAPPPEAAPPMPAEMAPPIQ